MLRISERLRQIFGKCSQHSERSEIGETLSRHFKRSEFACKCGCGYDDVSPELIDVLEEVRQFFDGQPVTVTSGCRCPRHNARVGGSAESQHLSGTAADIVTKGAVPREVATYLRNRFPNKYGIGEYETFVHIDVRRQKARW